MALRGAVVTVVSLAKRLGMTRQNAISILKKRGITVENPCSRCGAKTSLIRETDADMVENDYREWKRGISERKGQK